MTRLVADAAATGLRCPYCQFPLKQGASVERCDACGALHHGECWDDGGGCAVFGCANAGAATADATTPTQRLAPSPPVTQPAPASAGGRAIAIGVGIGLLVAAIGIGAFLLGSRTGDDGAVTPPATTAADEVPATAPPATPPPATQTPVPPPVAGPSEAEVARELEAIVDFSVAGRDAVRTGRYQEAIDNRLAVLRQLRALRGATGRVARARELLVQAMQASLASDRAYAAGRDASATDAEATRLKRLFVERFAPIASAHGLVVYGADDF